METVLQEIAKTFQERYGTQPQEFRDQMTLIVSPERITEVARVLRDSFGFKMLSDETAVDYWPEQTPRFHVIYQMRDLERRLLLTLRVPVNGEDPHVETMEKVFPNANWFEREIWDMFGIVFDEHSDLRRILMPSDWEGHPLRKDFPLGYEEVQFTFNQDEVMVRKPHPKE
jgi:NADH-quinone oxidoreductase subunit C